MYKFLIQKHLDSCYAADPVSGVLEFVEQLVDYRRLKAYSDQVVKANRMIESEMGQPIAPLPAFGDASASRRHSGADDAGGVDYQVLAKGHAEWVATNRSGSGRGLFERSGAGTRSCSGIAASPMMRRHASRCSGIRTGSPG